MPGPTPPFRRTEPDVTTGAYYSKHDLREMYTRENADRRRMGAHTLRKYLTMAQDKVYIAKALKIRDEYEVANNDDVVLALVQQWIREGKEKEIDPKLAAAAKAAVIPKRTRPFDEAPGKGH